MYTISVFANGKSSLIELLYLDLFLQRPIQENMNLFFAYRGGVGGAKRRRSRRGRQKTDSYSRELACAKTDPNITAKSMMICHAQKQIWYTYATKLRFN